MRQRFTCCRRGGALPWILLIVVAVGVFMLFGDQFSNLTTAPSKTATPRGTVNEFLREVIAFNEAGAKQLCKTGKEEMAAQSIQQLKALHEGAEMSRPDKFSVSMGSPVQEKPGEKVTAKAKIYGVNSDYGANSTVIVEMQEDGEWKVVEAYTAGAKSDLPVAF